MKNIITLVLCVMLAGISATAQSYYNNPAYFSTCYSGVNQITPIVGSVPGFYPADTALPASPAGQYVSDTIYFTNYTSFMGIALDSMKIDSLYLPAGLCWSCSKASNTFAGGEACVVYISGVPTAPAGQYKLKMTVDLQTSLGPVPNVDVESMTRLRYSLRIACASNPNPAYSYDTVDAFISDTICTPVINATITASGPTTFCQGDSVTLTASSGSGYTYLWTTGATTQSIVVTASGTYDVTILRNTGTGTITANATPVTVTVGCGGSSTGYSDPTYFSTCNSSTNSITPIVGAVPGFAPADSLLPVTLTGQYVRDTIYFTNYSTFSGVAIDSIKMDSLYLPAGLCWSSNKASNTFAGGEACVVYISGIPTAPAGQYKLRLVMDFYASLGTIHNADVESLTHMRYSLRIACANDPNPAYSYDTADAYIPDALCSSSLVATITASGPTSFCQGDSVTLSAPSGAGYSYLWSTGDSSQSVVALNSGSYTVTVYSGANSAVSSPVAVVLNQPFAHFQMMPDPNTPHVWEAVNQCTGTGLTYSWSWGDGTTGTGVTPNHAYSAAGYYDVCVAVTDSFRCSASYCDSSTYMYKSENQIVQLNVVRYALGINDINGSSLTIKYYANAIHFSSAITVPADVRLYDLSGRVIMKLSNWTGSTLPVDAAIANGVYVLAVQHSTLSISRKLDIVR